MPKKTSGKKKKNVALEEKYEKYIESLSEEEQEQLILRIATAEANPEITEKQKALAEELLVEVIKKLEFKELQGFAYTTPEGKHLIMFWIPTPGGNIACTYDPLPAAYELANFAEDLWCGMAENGFVTFHEHLSADKALEFVIRKHLESCLIILLTHIRQHLYEGLHNVLLDILVQSAVKYAEYGRSQPQSDKNASMRLINEVSKLVIEGNRQRWKKSALNARKARVDLLALREHYANALPLITEAKKCYQQNKKNSRWKAMIQAGYPDLPPDLINRLSNPDPYDSMPSTIALEFAARLCGIPADTYKPRTLWEYLARSKALSEKVPAGDS